MSKKKVLSLALAVIMIAIISFSTLAWFNDSDSVVNNFYIADSTDTAPDDIFSVDVWENTPEGTKEDTGYEYKDILPGDVLEKMVVVENTGYYDQYIRVTVTVTKAAAWQAVLNTTRVPALRDIVNGYDPNANVWISDSATIDTAKDTIVYVLYYNGILDGADTAVPEDSNNVTLFESVKIPTGMTQEQAAAFKTGFAIDVVAEAVQTENLGVDKSNNVLDAKEAFAAAGLN